MKYTIKDKYLSITQENAINRLQFVGRFFVSYGFFFLLFFTLAFIFGLISGILVLYSKDFDIERLRGFLDSNVFETVVSIFIYLSILLIIPVHRVLIIKRKNDLGWSSNLPVFILYAYSIPRVLIFLVHSFIFSLQKFAAPISLYNKFSLLIIVLLLLALSIVPQRKEM